MLSLIFTYAMTAVGAVSGLFNPHIGLLIYIAFAILQPESLWSWSVPSGSYSRIVAVALLVGWAFRGLGRWRFGRAGAIVGAFLSYWLWSVVSAFFAPDQKVAWAFVETLSKIVLPFMVGITIIKSVRQLKQVAWVIVAAHAFLAYEFNLSYYQGWNRLREMGHGGMDEIFVSVAFACAGGLAFFLALSARHWWVKAATLGSGLLMVNAVFFSFARTGMLGLLAVGMVGFLLKPKKITHYAAFALVIALGLRLAGPEVRKEFSTVFVDEAQRDSSAQSRLDLAADAWDAMRKNPILGLGPDHFPLIAHQYGWPEGKEVHNLWMQTGAELGFPGLIMLLAFYGFCIVRLWPLLGKRNTLADPWFGSAAQMVIASLVGFGVAACFVSIEGLEVPYYVVLIGAGVLKLSSLAQTENDKASSPSETDGGGSVSQYAEFGSKVIHRPQTIGVSGR
jgi:putative inorganic carbon (hco3(-)) transporter